MYLGSCICEVTSVYVHQYYTIFMDRFRLICGVCEIYSSYSMTYFLCDYLDDFIHARDHVQSFDFLFGYDKLTCILNYMLQLYLYLYIMLQLQFYLYTCIHLCMFISLFICIYMFICLYILAYNSLIVTELARQGYSMWLLLRYCY